VLLQRYWAAQGQPAVWTTIAALTTADEIASGERMAASDPDTYRVISADAADAA